LADHKGRPDTQNQNPIPVSIIAEVTLISVAPAADPPPRPGRISVDSKDSLLGANQIQGCFLGGSLGCDGAVGFERRGVGADGAADHRST
jgi:hypothetical protein